MNKKIFALFCTCLLFAAAASAGDYDLRVNGDFRGARPGAPVAPGWAASAGAVTRLLPDHKPGRAILEVASPANGATVVVSDLNEVHGNTLKFKAEIRGRGTASLGFEAFDFKRDRVIAADRRQFRAGPRFRDAKAVFDLRIPGIKYVRVSLIAEPGSVIGFRDVEGEFKVVRVAPPLPAPARRIPHQQSQPRGRHRIPSGAGRTALAARAHLPFGDGDRLYRRYSAGYGGGGLHVVVGYALANP